MTTLKNTAYKKVTIKDQVRSAPAQAADMKRFAASLKSNPAAAREFFVSAGILKPNGTLTARYRTR